MLGDRVGHLPRAPAATLHRCTLPHRAQPGNVDTPLAGKSKDEEGVRTYGEPSGAKVLSPSHIGDAVVYAVSQPAHVAVNEIMVEPRDEPC